MEHLGHPPACHDQQGQPVDGCDEGDATWTRGGAGGRQDAGHNLREAPSRSPGGGWRTQQQFGEHHGSSSRSTGGSTCRNRSEMGASSGMSDGDVRRHDAAAFRDNRGTRGNEHDGYDVPARGSGDVAYTQEHGYDGGNAGPSGGGGTWESRRDGREGGAAATFSADLRGDNAEIFDRGGRGSHDETHRRPAPMRHSWGSQHHAPKSMRQHDRGQGWDTWTGQYDRHMNVGHSSEVQGGSGSGPRSHSPRPTATFSTGHNQPRASEGGHNWMDAMDGYSGPASSNGHSWMDEGRLGWEGRRRESTTGYGGDDGGAKFTLEDWRRLSPGMRASGKFTGFGPLRRRFGEGTIHIVVGYEKSHELFPSRAHHRYPSIVALMTHRHCSISIASKA